MPMENQIVGQQAIDETIADILQYIPKESDETNVAGAWIRTNKVA